jgi:hypothetical protein
VTRGSPNLRVHFVILYIRSSFRIIFILFPSYYLVYLFVSGFRKNFGEFVQLRREVRPTFVVHFVITYSFLSIIYFYSFYFLFLVYLLYYVILHSFVLYYIPSYYIIFLTFLRRDFVKNLASLCSCDERFAQPSSSTSLSYIFIYSFPLYIIYFYSFIYYSLYIYYIILYYIILYYVYIPSIIPFCVGVS